MVFLVWGASYFWKSLLNHARLTFIKPPVPRSDTDGSVMRLRLLSSLFFQDLICEIFFVNEASLRSQIMWHDELLSNLVIGTKLLFFVLLGLRMCFGILLIIYFDLTSCFFLWAKFDWFLLFCYFVAPSVEWWRQFDGIVSLWYWRYFLPMVFSL